MKKYDVVATTGTYQKDGETKYLTDNIGVILQTDKGFRLKLKASFNPAGCKIDDDGYIWCALFEPRPKDDTQRQAHHNQTGGQPVPPADDGLDIPFIDPYKFNWRAV